MPISGRRGIVAKDIEREISSVLSNEELSARELREQLNTGKPSLARWSMIGLHKVLDHMVDAGEITWRVVSKIVNGVTVQVRMYRRGHHF